MRKWFFESFGGVEKLRLVDASSPEPGAGEAVVSPSYVGVNPVDRSVLGGRFDWIRLPHTPGAEVVGRVVSVGDHVGQVRRGDRVAVYPPVFCGTCKWCLRGEEGSCLENTHLESAPGIIGVVSDGGWSEEFLVPARNLFKLPPSVDDRHVVGMPVDGLTAQHLLERAELKPGELALIVGAAGGVGSFAVQLASLRGCTVIAVCSSEKQAEVVRGLGAGDVVFSGQNRKVSDQVKSIAGGGVDVVIDPVGASTWKESLACLGPFGRYATCGVLTGRSVELDLLTLYSMQNKVVGSTTGSRRNFAEVLNYMEQGRLRTLIDSEYDFEHIPDAVTRLSVRGRTGKVVAKVN
ncbi:MAG: zinc-binding dehydrogenase [Thermoprotei archaeon]